MKRALIFVSVVGALFILGAAVANAHSRHRVSFPQRHVDRVTYKDLRHKLTTTTAKPTTTTRPTSTTQKPTTTTTTAPTTTTASQWQLEFSEDFNTDAAEGSFLKTYSDFDAYPYPWKDTSGYGTYQPNILSVANGNLQIHLHTVNGEHLVAAPEPKVNNGQTDQLYGRYEIRFKADQIHGYKTAYLLWAQSDQWSDGEIDFPEGDLDGNIEAFNHYAGNPTSQDGFSTGADYSQWHDAVTTWEPGKVTFQLDGRTIGTSTSHVMAKPAHLVLQSETALGQGEPADNVDGSILVDYVRAWRYAN